MLGKFYRDLGAVMCKNGVYLRDDIPMVLNKQKNRLEVLTASAFRSYVDDHVYLYGLEYDKNTDSSSEYRKSITRDISADCLGSFAFKNMQRYIRRKNDVPMPVMRAGNRVELLMPGFDHETQILTMPSNLKYELMPVDEARTQYMNFFRNYPFEGTDPATGLSRSLSAHAAAMLTPFCMALLSPKSLIPMFIYTANKAGCGKSGLCKSAMYPSFGTAAALPYGRDEEELRKQLDTEAIEAVPYIFFDNVKRKIQSSLLDLWMTQPEWKGRRMGGQHEFKVEKQCVVYVSSNHAELDKDANRRALFIELFLEQVDINDRQFDRIIDDDYLANENTRRDMLSWLWSFVAHWDKLGRPAGPRRLASFEQWSRVIGGIVHCCGLGDPLEPHAVEFGDTDSKDIRVLVAELASKIDPDKDGDEFEFDQLIDICRKHDLFVQRIDGKKKDNGDFELSRSSRIQMGKFFKRESGQVWNLDGIGKIRFGRKGSKNWRAFHVDRVK